MTLLTFVSILMLAPAVIFAVLFLSLAAGIVRLNEDDEQD